MKKRSCARQGILISLVKSRSPTCTCPHWDSVHLACLLVKDGLFLPIEQHVATYCLSGSYTTCPHYERLTDANRPDSDASPPPLNRRRSLRISQHHIFRFSEMTGNDGNFGAPENQGWTIDFSEHGIRFVGQNLLTPETTIHFFLETDGTGRKMEGTGRVIWSETLEKTPLFHSAIAFSDFSGTTQSPKRSSLKKV